MTIQEISYLVDLIIALLWQYDNAPILTSIITQKQEWYNTNQTQFWTDWYTNVFNLQTANAFGLTVWAIILGIPLQVLQLPNDGPLFGFASETMTPNDNQNFENGNFSNFNSEEYYLTVEQLRLILRLRYFQLTSRCAIPEINAFLAILFVGQGNVFIVDHLNMSITLYFGFAPDPDVLQAIREFDLIPRASGVLLNYVIDTGSIFGFGSETMTPNTNQNFENGNFIEEFY